MMLPFDSHNHVHMGSTPAIHALLDKSVSPATPFLSGMAIMSTQPKDFERVHGICRDLSLELPGTQLIPCFGVHPWFLHELTDDDWQLQDSGEYSTPQWLFVLETFLKSTPGSIVGEIGLDGFHFDGETRQLTSAMEKQVYAFQLQLDLAYRLNRPVSIHAVQCFGLLMETLSKRKNMLPPKLYFHAFGGKVGTIDQLLALCGKDRVYFGFAAVINFRSPKTASVIQKIGLERLLLETDHEDADLILSSMEEGIKYIADALEMSPHRVIQQTNINAHRFYGINITS